MTQLPKIAGITLPVDEAGRINLNALHRASGADGNKVPSQWLRTKTAQELVEALSSQTGNSRSGTYGLQAQTSEPVPRSIVKVTHGGVNPGSWADMGLAVAYAFWIRPQFQLEVISEVSDFLKIIEALEAFEVPEDLSDVYVYAIRNTHTRNVKLGISRDPQARLKQLQLGNDHKLELVTYRKSDNPHREKAALHEDNANYRKLGEWFDGEVLENNQIPSTTTY